jgi:hypothetical protein
MQTQFRTALVAGLLLTGRLSADVISYSGEVSGNVPTSLDIVVQQFNADPNHDGTAEYQLTSVTLQIVGYQDAKLALTQVSGSEYPSDVVLSHGSIKFGNGTLIASASPTYTGEVSVPANTTENIYPSTVSASSGLQTFTTALSAFVGDGSVNNMTVSFGGSWSVDSLVGQGAGFSVVSHTGTADWTVTYGYSDISPIPEPCTSALMIFGGAAIVLRRRFRLWHRSVR